MKRLGASCIAILALGGVLQSQDLPSRLPGARPATWREVVAAQKQAGWDIHRPSVDLPEGLIVHEDLVYARRGERELALDLYLPKAGGRSPLVVIIHGGGWKSGSKESQRNQAVWFASHGYAIASIEYRLSGEAVFPAALDDCNAAIEMLKTRGGQFGYDPDRLALWGGSAGAHLAALVATTRTDIAAAMLIAGPVDLTNERVREESADPESNYYRFFGGSHAQNARLYEQASPRHHVSDKTPPILLVTEGSLDGAAPFLDQLKTHRVYCETMLLSGGIHGHWNWEPWFTATMERCDRFLRKVLGIGRRGVTRPNVVLIMADDLGAENLACYGNTVYSTPNLDRMAAEGARFENAYATPVCTPTRAMILTGLYPNRSGFLERLDSPLDPDKNNRLPVHLKTFGQVFQAAGYATAIAGKWHLGDFQRYPDQPTSHGFDQYCLWVQYWDGARRSRYYAPHVWEDGQYKVLGQDVFGPDYYCDFLLDFVQRNRDRPFLAYFPMNLIHGPLVTPPGDLSSAEAGYPDELGPRERKAGQMVHYADAIVGRVLSKLKELGLDENTLVIFTGDNGTAGNLVSRLGAYRLRGGKRTMNEAGTRVPLIARWPGRIPPGRRDSLITLMDMLPTLASLANVPCELQVDGMDLSHNLLGEPGKDREYFMMAFEGGVYFVRDQRFRLHEDGRFYDVPVVNDAARYSMDLVKDADLRPDVRERLQARLDEFMAIRQTDASYTIIPFGTNGDVFKNSQSKTGETASGRRKAG